MQQNTKGLLLFVFLISVSLFGINLFNNNDSNKLPINLQDATKWSFQEALNNEFSSLGLYLSAHPLDSYSNILSTMNVRRSIEILNEPENYIKQNLKL